VNPDIERLLTLQRDDAELDGLNRRLHDLDAGVRALERERAEAATNVDKARADLAAEEKRHRELQSKFSEHKQLQEKNLAQLDAVKKAREATAAMSQIDITRRALMQDESDLQTADQRARSLRDQVVARELVLLEIDERIRDTRASTAGERELIEREIAAARHDLVITLDELEGAMRERLRWRTWVRRRPIAFCAGAVALGLLLGLR